MENFVLHPLLFIYQIIQFFLDKILSPKPPADKEELQRPKIAVIGAGLTGVSAASHCKSGFQYQYLNLQFPVSLSDTVLWEVN